MNFRRILLCAAVLAGVVPLTSQAKIDTVTTSGLTFVPASLAIHHGDTVRWVNPAGIHTTTSDVSSPKAWNSGTMNAGQQFDVVFSLADGPGPFPYICSFHVTLGMTGTITIAPPSCCTGMRGNVNMTGGIDLSDLSALVNYLTGGSFVPPCLDAANVNGAGGVDLSDLSSLVNYLTGGSFVPPNCP